MFLSVLDPESKDVTSLQGFTGESGQAVITWETSKKQGTGEYTVIVTDVLMDGYLYDSEDKVTFNVE